MDWRYWVTVLHIYGRPLFKIRFYPVGRREGDMQFNIRVSVEYDISNIPMCADRTYGLEILDHGATYIRKTTIQDMILSGGSKRG
jgi:hypothetical protein